MTLIASRNPQKIDRTQISDEINHKSRFITIYHRAIYDPADFTLLVVAYYCKNLRLGKRRCRNGIVIRVQDEVLPNQLDNEVKARVYGNAVNCEEDECAGYGKGYRKTVIPTPSAIPRGLDPIIYGHNGGRPGDLPVCTSWGSPQFTVLRRLHRGSSPRYTRFLP